MSSPRAQDLKGTFYPRKYQKKKTINDVVAIFIFIHFHKYNRFRGLYKEKITSNNSLIFFDLN